LQSRECLNEDTERTTSEKVGRRYLMKRIRRGDIAFLTPGYGDTGGRL